MIKPTDTRIYEVTVETRHIDKFNKLINYLWEEYLEPEDISDDTTKRLVVTHVSVDATNDIRERVRQLGRAYFTISQKDI